MFATLLRIGKQVLCQLLVLLHGGAARSGAGNREGHGMAVVDLDQCFRTGADNVEIAALGIGQRHEIHVRARIERAQHAIDIERIGR